MLWSVEDAGCDSLTKDVVPRECYFILVFTFCFLIIRIGILKTYILEPSVAIFSIIGTTLNQLVSQACLGICICFFVSLCSTINVAVESSEYDTAISLTLIGLLLILLGLFSFGAHVRSFIHR